jgi:hypothetical protein
MILPELFIAYLNYSNKQTSRDASRIQRFSESIFRDFPNYQNHLQEVINWERFARQEHSLKFADLHKIVSFFAKLGLPNEPEVSKRLSECFFIWLSANWAIYSHIVTNASRVVSKSIASLPPRSLVISLDEIAVGAVHAATGVLLQPFYIIENPIHKSIDNHQSAYVDVPQEESAALAEINFNQMSPKGPEIERPQQILPPISTIIAMIHA